MAKYLVDTNLPYYFSLWRTDDYVFQRDFDPSAPDTDVWEYARERELTIITKDRDYSDRILLTSPSPRIFHLKIGNLRMREFHEFISAQWAIILELSTTHKLLYVFLNRIECIE
jgi:predicted nuclease of predicted toxin-antitoxin system